MPSIDEVHQMYKKIKLSNNPVCNKCKPLHKTPVSIWYVGSKFTHDKYKILFVGKTGRDAWDINKKLGYDSLPKEEVEDRFLNYTNQFWMYTREIVSEIHGSPEKGLHRIAFTNIMKCPDTATVDTTDDSVKDNCILKLGVIQKEIEILKPKNVIFYTGPQYDDQIDGLINNLKISFNAQKIVTLSKRNIKVGSKGNPLKLYQMELLDRKGKLIIRFLITSHPQGQNEARFVSNLTRWILKGNNK